jgi:hypothetical protein
MKCIRDLALTVLVRSLRRSTVHARTTLLRSRCVPVLAFSYDALAALACTTDSALGRARTTCLPAMFPRRRCLLEAAYQRTGAFRMFAKLNFSSAKRFAYPSSCSTRSDAATRQPSQPMPGGSIVAAPAAVLAAPGCAVAETANAAMDTSAPKTSSGSAPSAPIASIAAPSAPPMPAAVASPVELQSYEISPYKSGSDRCGLWSTRAD